MKRFGFEVALFAVVAAVTFSVPRKPVGTTEAPPRFKEVIEPPTRILLPPRTGPALVSVFHDDHWFVCAIKEGEIVQFTHHPKCHCFSGGMRLKMPPQGERDL